MSTEITIKIGRKTARTVAPDSWNDLPLRSLLLFYNTLFEHQGPEHRQTVWTMSKLLSMTMHLLQLDHKTMLAWEVSCRAEHPDDVEAGAAAFHDEVRQVLHATLAGLFDIKEVDDTTTYAVKYNLTKNPYPRISHTKKGQAPKFLHCAADGLENITIYELAATFTAYENYLATGEEEEINTLLAILYRPQKPITRDNEAMAFEGDKRLPYRRYEATVPDRARMMAKLAPLVRRVMVFWFASCRLAIVDAFPDVFRSTGKSSSSKTDFGWGATLLAVAGGPVGLETVADQNHANALTWLAMKQREVEEAEQRLRETRRRR